MLSHPQQEVRGIRLQQLQHALNQLRDLNGLVMDIGQILLLPFGIIGPPFG
ncbi:hypothetical protein D3C75_1293210 [compost metagenome]